MGTVYRKLMSKFAGYFFFNEFHFVGKHILICRKFIYIIPCMVTSVTKILNMSHQVDMALPGHNDVLNRSQLMEACEGHLQSCGKWRMLRKSMSRARANVVLAINAKQNFPIPSTTRLAMRDWIKR